MTRLACPRCGSADVYRRWWAGSAAVAVCFVCGRLWKTRSVLAKRLPSTEQRRAQQQRADAAQAAERPRHA